jgi:hypothetical protein
VILTSLGWRVGTVRMIRKLVVPILSRVSTSALDGYIYSQPWNEEGRMEQNLELVRRSERKLLEVSSTDFVQIAWWDIRSPMCYLIIF